MAKKLKTTFPDVCRGCVNPLPLPPRVVEEDGRLVRKQVFLCGRFAAHEAAVKMITDSTCPGKQLTV